MKIRRKCCAVTGSPEVFGKVVSGKVDQSRGLHRAAHHVRMIGFELRRTESSSIAAEKRKNISKTL